MVPLVKKVLARKYDLCHRVTDCCLSFFVCVTNNTVHSANVLWLRPLLVWIEALEAESSPGKESFAGWRTMLLKQGHGHHGLWALLPTAVSLLS